MAVLEVLAVPLEVPLEVLEAWLLSWVDSEEELLAVPEVPEEQVALLVSLEALVVREAMRQRELLEPELLLL